VHAAFDYVMTDHAAWSEAGGRKQRIFATKGGGRWLVQLHRGSLSLECLKGEGVAPDYDIFISPTILGTNAELNAAVSSLGAVMRFRNNDLWDAIGTSIIRQVIRAGQAKKLYRIFCDTYGEAIELPDGTSYSLFPTAEVVHDLSDDGFSAIGMAFKRGPLKAAAQAFLAHGATWLKLDPEALIMALQVVPRIGPWTAQAAVADWTNDWSLYPYADLAVRTWAKKAAPTFIWPTDEPTFGRVWRGLAGEHLSSITLLTLAWGSQYADVL
jgi:DNA-3-methyladenine glycosylase II